MVRIEDRVQKNIERKERAIRVFRKAEKIFSSFQDIEIHSLGSDNDGSLIIGRKGYYGTTCVLADVGDKIVEVKNKDYLKAAIKLAEFYENEGFGEFTVRKNWNYG